MAFIFLLLLIGQFLNNKRGAYPLVVWDMFSQPLEVNSISILQLEGLTSRGERVRLPIAQYYPVKYYLIPGDIGPGVRDPSIPAIVKAAAVGYNVSHPDNPVVRVELGTMDVPLHPKGPVKEVKWTVLNSYSIGWVPSKF